MHSLFKPVGGEKNAFIVLLFFVLLILWGFKGSTPLLRAAVNGEIALKTKDFKKIETGHYVIKYTDVNEDSVYIVAKTAEEAYNEVCAWFKRTPSFKATIIVYPDTASLAESFGWDRDEKAMGVYWAGSIRILAPEAYLMPDEIDKKFKKEGPMVHEFAHLMVDEITKGNYNRWLTEGIAQYVEKKITGFEFASPFSGGKEVKYYKLSELNRNFDNLEQNIAYWQSLQIVEYIAEVYGEDKIFSILQYLGKGYNLNRALEEALGTGYEDFEEELYEEWQKN